MSKREYPPLPWGTKQKDVIARQALLKKYLKEGGFQEGGISKAEAERKVFLAIFRSHVRYYMNQKNLSQESLILAINEALTEEVMES